MKNLSLFSVMIFTTLLIGSCNYKSTLTLQPVNMPWHHWTCDSDAFIEWAYEDSSEKKVQLRIDDSRQLFSLSKIYETDIGILYSNGEIAFRIKDNSAIVFYTSNDEIIGRDCK